MKLIFAILITFNSLDIFGQFAIITDKDGFVNVRNPENTKNIIDTISNGKIVWCFEQEGEWFWVDYYKNDAETKSGYIHKSRLKFLNQFDSIPFKQLSENLVILEKDSIKVTMIESSFSSKNKSLKYDNEIGSKFLSKINNQRIWGTDGDMPKTEYKSIVIEMGKRKIKLPKSGLENLFEPNLEYTTVNYDPLNDRLYIASLNSDAAGSYAVLWIIEKGKYKERTLFIPF